MLRELVAYVYHSIRNGQFNLETSIHALRDSEKSRAFQYRLSHTRVGAASSLRTDGQFLGRARIIFAANLRVE